MSHSNELRELALGASLASQPEKAAAARAGAEALDTVDEQAETIKTLSRLLAEAEEAAIERAAQIERVRDAYDHAHTLITEALEGET